MQGVGVELTELLGQQIVPSVCLSIKVRACVCAGAYTHRSRARCRTEQWWIGSHRPLVCSFPESSRWLRSSQGSKATTGSQQHPSLWNRDLRQPFVSGWRQIESVYLSLTASSLTFLWWKMNSCTLCLRQDISLSVSVLICCRWCDDDVHQIVLRV